MAIDKSWKQLKADEMRRNPTPPEAMLWGMMRMSQIAYQHYVDRDEQPPIHLLFNLEFERQAIVHGWIVDFFFPEVGLAIEVDGKYHESSKQSDAARDRILSEKYGITTLRFTTNEIYTESEEVIQKITDNIFDYLFEIDFQKYCEAQNGAR